MEEPSDAWVLIIAIRDPALVIRKQHPPHKHRQPFPAPFLAHAPGRYGSTLRSGGFWVASRLTEPNWQHDGRMGRSNRIAAGANCRRPQWSAFQSAPPLNKTRPILFRSGLGQNLGAALMIFRRGQLVRPIELRNLPQFGLFGLGTCRRRGFNRSGWSRVFDWARGF